MFSFRELQRKGIYIGVFALLANIFYDKAFGPFAFTILVTFQFLLISALFLKRQQVVNTVSIGLGLILAYACSIIISRDSIFVSNLFKWVSLGVLGLYLYLLGNDKTTFSSLFELVVAPLRSIVQYAQAGIRLCKTFFLKKYRAENLQMDRQADHSKKKALIIGVVVAVPILAILTSLLAQGDPIF